MAIPMRFSKRTRIRIWLPGFFLRYLSSTENQIRVVEATGSLPLSTITIGQLSDFRQAHPVWDQSLQYLALAQPIPDTPGWMDAESRAFGYGLAIKIHRSQGEPAHDPQRS